MPVCPLLASPARAIAAEPPRTGDATPAPTVADAPAANDAAAERRARVERFLDELERSGTTIETLSGGLSLEKHDAFVEETERRFGRIVVDRKAGARRFAILFDEFVDATGRSSRAVDHWIFADGWLVEQDHANRSFTKRQIVAPGQSLDPLALGEGPIPIPIGQRKSEVLARFEVDEGELPQDVAMLGSLRDVAALRLVPKDGTTMAKETASIDLYYDRTTLAPVGVVIRERNGNRTAARISQPVVNGAVKDEDRALLEIPSPDPREWAIDIRPWQGADDRDAGSPATPAKPGGSPDADTR
ncbi:MAG: hypothetical protein RI967_761 [Planctomycetota bacterium]